MGDSNKSLEYSTKALEIREKIFSGDNKNKATFYGNIGTIYQNMGDLNKSLEYSTKALEMTERLFPKTIKYFTFVCFNSLIDIA